MRAVGERGAVAVEAALVTPLLMVLILGIIEMALLMKDDVALTSAVRNGGRTASANAGRGTRRGATTTATASRRARRPTRRCSPSWPPTPSSAPGTALPKDSIKELWVYKANNKGYPGAERHHHGLRHELREVQVDATPRTSSATTADRGSPPRSTPAPTTTRTRSAST